LVAKVKPNINSAEIHPQLGNNRHPVDGALVGVGSLWPCICTYQGLSNETKCMMGGTMVWEIST